MVIYFTVDTTPPTTTNNAPEGWQNTAFNIALTCNDGGLSGCSFTTYRVDGGSWTNGTTISITTDGNHTFEYYSVDVAGNTEAMNTDYAALDITPPTITIQSPTNATYSRTNIELNVSANEPIHTWQYSLNGAANVSFTPNTTFTAPEGANSIVVTANDTAGNRNTATVYFTIDTIPPTVRIDSPTNITYAQASVWVNVTLNENSGSATVQLDGAANYSLTNFSGNWNYQLTGLSDGGHTVRIHANDSVGNMNSTQTVSFTVDATPPTITIQSPTNTTYQATYFNLNFTAVDALSGVAWTGYSLDGGPNVTSGNTTLYENANGSHRITVYANDSIGHMNSNTVYFTLKPLAIFLGLATDQWSYGRGNRVTITANVTNSDNVSRNNLKVNFLVWDPNAVLVHNDTVQVPNLNPGDSKSVFTRFTLSSNATLGNYTVKAKLFDPVKTYDIKGTGFQVA